MLYSFDTHDTDTDTETEPKTTAAAPKTHTADDRCDEDLMIAIQGRDEAALGVLYKRHTALLRTIVNRVINNDTDTDDLLQEIFCEVWRMAEHYSQDKGKALGWIVTLARRRAIDKLRKKQAYQRAGDRLRVEVEHSSDAHMQQGADEDAASADRAEILQRVIGTLPPPQREAITYAFYRGMSQREIASHTGIPLGTIKTRLELAVRKVRTAILAMGGSGEWSPTHS
jgi:RNA polymerase sigma-70 factor, ECF subfamily